MYCFTARSVNQAVEFQKYMAGRIGKDLAGNRHILIIPTFFLEELNKTRNPAGRRTDDTVEIRKRHVPNADLEQPVMLLCPKNVELVT